MDVSTQRGAFFEDLSVGLRTVTPARTVTEADIVAFAGLSGDYNPLHTDEEFARRTHFGRRVAHGALIFSIATGLRQRTGLFEGTVVAFTKVLGWRFRRPVLVGDTIHCVSEVDELRDAKRADWGTVVHAIEVRNQDEEVVADGAFELIVRRRASSEGGAAE